MDEQKTDLDDQTQDDQEPTEINRHSRSPLDHNEFNFVMQPPRKDKVPEHYRWDDCM